LQQPAIKPDEERRIDKYPNTNIEAYDYLLNAQELINKYWLTRNGDYSSSIHFFVDKALEIDPESPGVNLGKANAFLIDCTEDAQHLKVPNWDSIHYYADIALQLDPEYAEAYGMKGNVYDEQGMNDKAIEYLSKAIDLSPNDRELNLKLAEILNGSEKTQIDLIRGMTYLRKTIGTYNDSDPNKAYQIAAYYDFLDEFSKAEKHYLKSMKLGMTLPSYRAYSAFLILHGKPWEAIWFIDSVYMDQTDRTSLTRRIWGYIEINEFEKAERYYEKILDGGFRILRGDSIRLGYMYLETNREAHAKSILSTIREQIEIRLSDRKHFWDLYDLCMIHAILNEAKEALRYLSEIEEFYVLMNYQKYIESSIVFSNIRNTPEFRAIMERSKAKNEATRAQIKEMEKREGFDM